MIHLSVDGAQIGDTVSLPEPGTVEVEAWAESIFPIHTLQIVQRGRVVASGRGRERRAPARAARAAHGRRQHLARGALRRPALHGASRITTAGRAAIFAHTSPIYVACGGEWSMFDEATARYMLTLVDGCLTYIDTAAPYWEPGSVTHHHGEDDHLAWLRRPFLEARDAVEKRLAQHGLL